MTLRIESISSDVTESLAERLGQKLKGGEVIELVSDLGGGKTTFVRGLARGIGSEDRVNSPTFTVSKVYRSDKLELHHFDFYRLPEAGLIAHELSDILGEPTKVAVVEWGDAVAHVLPETRLTIRITNIGEENRSIELLFPEKLRYLAEGL